MSGAAVNRVSKTVNDGASVTMKYIVDTVGSLPTILMEFDVDFGTGTIGS